MLGEDGPWGCGPLGEEELGRSGRGQRVLAHFK